MALTNVVIRNSKPKDKVYKLTDGGGMYLLVTPKGSKYWRMKYYINGKEKVASLGVYPEVSLIEARAKQAKLKQDHKNKKKKKKALYLTNTLKISLSG